MVSGLITCCLDAADQPGRDRMQELDTYMQPHYDPSMLTINLHLSPLDFRGCRSLF